MIREVLPHDQAPALPGAEPISPDRLSHARRAYGSYYRWVRLSRLALTAVLLLGVFLVLWLVPWLPSGLDTADYTPQVAFTVYLLGTVAVTATIALACSELARRRRESLTAWAAVYDEATGLHNRTYLYDRLALECDRAKRNSTSFSLIVLQVRNASRAERAAPTLSHQTLQRVAELINGITHPTDLVAMLSSSELAVLTIGVDRETRRILQERLRLAVANEVARLADDTTASEVKSGAATYGADGIEASVIVQSARNAAVLGTPQRGQAAA